MARIYSTKMITKSYLDELEALGHQVDIWNDLENGPLPYDKLLEVIPEYDALISMLSDRIDKTIIDAATKLKVISQYAVGYNNIDTKAASEKNIVVTNTPDVLTHATAELAFALLLSCARKIIPAAKNVEEDKWRGWEPQGFLGKSLKKTKVGIIGPGRIGAEFAKMCHGAFDSEILYHSRSSKPELEEKFSAKKLELDELLKQSDIISLHCPLTDETRDLLNERTLELCKDDAIIINTARGEVIDQDALIKFLKKGKFHSIGLDVTTPEPLPHNNQLKGFERVLIIPHIGSATTHARAQMSQLVCKNIEMVLNNLPPQTPVTY
jgi:glyoxylate reductase